MPSSIYKIDVDFKVVGSVSSLTKGIGGSGYTFVPTVTIDPPTSGTTATGTAVLVGTSIPTGTGSITVTNQGDYGDFSGTVGLLFTGGGGSGANGTFTITNGLVTATDVTNGGSGYTSIPTVTFTTFKTGQTAAEGFVIELSSTSVDFFIVDDGGSGYESNPAVVVEDPTSGTTATATSDLLEVAAEAELLNTPIVITADQVSPGGGGVLRVYFALDLDGASLETEVTVTNNGVKKGILNADNSSNIALDGYYRFDIDIEEGDSLNFETLIAVDLIHFFRAHLIVFGA